MEGNAVSGRVYPDILSISSLNYPTGVAVDGSGNVYIADTNNSRVLKETLSAGRVHRECCRRLLYQRKYFSIGNRGR